MRERRKPAIQRLLSWLLNNITTKPDRVGSAPPAAISLKPSDVREVIKYPKRIPIPIASPRFLLN